MSEQSLGSSSWTYNVREAVGLFADPDALEAAVDELEIAGFDRAGISVLGAGDEVKERIGHLYRKVAEVEDDERAPHAAFVSKDTVVEGETAVVTVPLYIGAVSGAAVVIASGGALAAAIAATILAGATGAGLGGLLAYAIAKRHVEHIEEQLAKGGLLLWVNVPDKNSEKRALDILNKSGAKHIHVHEVQRQWDMKDRPLSEAQFDPFLEHD